MLVSVRVLSVPHQHATCPACQSHCLSSHAQPTGAQWHRESTAGPAMQLHQLPARSPPVDRLAQPRPACPSPAPCSHAQGAHGQKPSRRRHVAHARPLSSDNLVEVLEKAVQHPDKVVPEVAESVTTSVDAMTVSVKKQARHLINSPTSACIALNLGAALFGSNQVAIKYAEGTLSPGAMSALRFGIAALCFAPNAVRGFKNAGLRRASVELGLYLFGGYICQAWGLEYTTAGRAAFTFTFTVLAVPILASFTGRKIPAATWVAGAVALLGVSLLTSGGTGFNKGDALCILSAFIFGMHKFRTESVTQKFEDTQDLVAVQLAVLAFCSFLASAPALWHLIPNSTPEELWQMTVDLPWPALIFMGTGTTALTLWLEVFALKQVSAPLAALIYSSEPLWGAMFAWVIGGERWGPKGWWGAALIIGSSLASQFGGDKTKKPQEALAKADD